MKLDVVVPTYNRCALLQRTLRSLQRASLPADVELTIYVVDNNSRDATAAVVSASSVAAKMQAETTPRLVYLKEARQGISHARNTGIAAGVGEVLGFIDDDEEVSEGWIETIAREFRDEATDFIGGPYLANCAVAMPNWLPPGYNGVVGVTPPAPRGHYGRGYRGNLNGGNAVLRRSVFDRVGMYDPRLGRSSRGLLSEEDADLYRRILQAGLRGIFVPELAIYHHIPPSRLTRSYYRRWCYWRGISQGIADRSRREPVSYLGGVPRYRVRAALGGIAALPRNLSATHGSGRAFAKELAMWDFAGFVRGKYFLEPESLYATAK